jgi:hypothetical protein
MAPMVIVGIGILAYVLTISNGFVFALLHSPSRELYGGLTGVLSRYRTLSLYMGTMIAVTFWIILFSAERYRYLRKKNNIFNR